MRRVLFVSKNSPYNAGDIAGFEDDHAKRLVDGGVAQYDDGLDEHGRAPVESSLPAELLASITNDQAVSESSPGRPGRPARG